MRRALALALALGLATDAVAAEPVRKFVTVATEGSPWGDAAVSFSRRVAAETRGRLKIRPFLGALAGDEVDTARLCQQGKVLLWAGSPAAFAEVVPELNALELPFLFRDSGEVDASLVGSPVSILGRAFERRGLALVPPLTELGWRSFAGPKPLRALADFRGLRVRSQENPVHLEMWRLLGAQPRAISVVETYNALQAGVVQAFDQVPVYLFATSWYQQARVYTLSRHVYQPGIVVLCKGALASLAPADRALILDVARQELAATVGKVRTLEAQVLAQLGKEGVQVVALTEAERAALAQQTRPVYRLFRESTTPLGRELLGAVERAIEAHRKGAR